MNEVDSAIFILLRDCLFLNAIDYLSQENGLKVKESFHHVYIFIDQSEICIHFPGLP